MDEKVWGVSKPAANYRPAPKAKVRCDACRYMLPKAPAGACKLVRGLIRGSDTCDLFRPAKKRKRR